MAMRKPSASRPAAGLPSQATAAPVELLPLAAAAPSGDDEDAAAFARMRRSSVAPSVTCGLCGRILRDATTISECLHSFCRKCIFQKFEDEDIKYCPTCNTNLGCSPLLRSDHSLQRISSLIFPSKKRNVVEISALFPALAFLPSPSHETDVDDHSTKKRGAYLLAEPMRTEIETEPGEKVGVEHSASPTKPSALSLDSFRHIPATTIIIKGGNEVEKEEIALDHPVLATSDKGDPRKLTPISEKVIERHTTSVTRVPDQYSIEIQTNSPSVHPASTVVASSGPICAPTSVQYDENLRSELCGGCHENSERMLQHIDSYMSQSQVYKEVATSKEEMQNTILEKNEAFEGARILEGRIKEQIERYEIESERSQAIWEEMLRKMLQPPQKPLMNIDRIPFVMKEFMDANAKLVTAINNEWTAVHNERQRLCDWQHELDQKTTELANRESKAAETEAALNLWVQKLNAQAAELAEEDKKSKERSKRLGENAKALSDLDRTLKAQEEELKRCKEKLKEQEKHTDLPARLEFEQQLKEVREAISELQQARATEAEMIQQVVSTISSVLQPFGLSFVRSKSAARTVKEMLPELTAAVEKLVPLPEVVSEALETEGAELARAVAEHVLRCYRSRKPDFPLEPALSGPVEETAEEVGTDAGLQDAAKAVASRFERIPRGHE